MIFLSTLIKVASVTTILLVAGGSTYYYWQNDNSSKVETKNLKGHHDHSTHFLHGKMDDEEVHICNHGHFIKDIEIEEPERSAEIPLEARLSHEQMLIKNHKQGNWDTIRIKTDYSSFQASQQQADFIENKLVRAATGFLKAAIKVYPSSKLFLSGQCGSVTIPSSFKNGVTGVDLVLFVTATTSQDTWVARAGACRLDPTTLRPTAGSLEFNLKYFNQLDFSKLSEGKWFKWIQTTIHEVTHVLGFSSGLFPYYIDPNTMQKLGVSQIVKTQGGRDWIILPKVVNAVKSHFGCQSAWGAPLENNGGQGTAGSHWERTTFGNEAMTGSEFPDSVFTLFTFNLLESTGWYNMDHKQSEPFNWGKDEGCPIAQGQCAKGLREFCTAGSEGCSSDFTGIASCSQNDVLTDGCGYWRAYGNSDCRYNSDFTSQLAQYGGYYGNDGKCFLTTLPTKIGFQGVVSDCFKAVCQDNVVTLTISNKSYQCVSSGQTINIKYSYYSATVTCPDIKHFCNTQRICPNACSGVGTCRGTTCYCWSGYSGADCSVSY
ncbi:unnamed protein product [Paramecium octaurelia]|uniref:Uncharacterized protein n=1 Tax=Paramecium octaurelia TaxID=43137 RepID=A0A8S1TSF7_PAROT|nr:unnamed protein product [Paramecium octaurelia]